MKSALVIPQAEILKDRSDLATLTEADLQSQEAIVDRNELLAASKELEHVRGDVSQKASAEMLNRLSKYAKEVEASRVDVKRPFLTVTGLIDSMAKKFVDPIVVEINRHKRLLADYQQELNRKAEAERQKAEAERRRLEEEQRKLQEDANRKAEAAAAKGDDAKVEQILQVAELKTAELQLQAATTLVAPEQKKVAGLSTPMVRVFQVEDIEALYKAHPGLVEMSPKAAAINSFIRQKGPNGQYIHASVPGLVLTETIAVRTR